MFLYFPRNEPHPFSLTKDQPCFYPFFFHSISFQFCKKIPETIIYSYMPFFLYVFHCAWLSHTLSCLQFFFSPRLKFTASRHEPTTSVRSMFTPIIKDRSTSISGNLLSDTERKLLLPQNFPQPYLRLSTSEILLLSESDNNLNITGGGWVPRDPQIYKLPSTWSDIWKEMTMSVQFAKLYIYYSISENAKVERTYYYYLAQYIWNRNGNVFITVPNKLLLFPYKIRGLHM